MKAKINLFTLSISFILISSCTVNNSNSKSTEFLKKQKSLDKIQVLNFGTFHMGFTNDASTTEFDEHNLENQKNIHEIAKKIAAFKPTVIIVEWLPKYNESLQEVYNEYLENPSMFFKRPSEVELLAYELGRLSDTKRIFGIDHQMDYNYNIGNEIKNSIDSIWYNKYKADPLSFFPEVNIEDDSSDLLSKLKLKNHDKYLDFLISVNADKLTHTGSKNGFEGADEAAKFYQRNLRMYSNLNRIDLQKDDRVFILMGASHTAFFRDFMSRSHKYEMVNTFKYLK
jgi:hypothetical protein